MLVCFCFFFSLENYSAKFSEAFFKHTKKTKQCKEQVSGQPESPPPPQALVGTSIWEDGQEKLSVHMAASAPLNEDSNLHLSGRRTEEGGERDCSTHCHSRKQLSHQKPGVCPITEGISPTHSPLSISSEHSQVGFILRNLF